MTKLNRIKSIWNFLSGKKRNIGGLLVIISQALVLLGHSEWASWVTQISEWCFSVGLGTMGVGFLDALIVPSKKMLG